jgi:aminoglycoside phosphotransferase (APT) family kinase protein
VLRIRRPGLTWFAKLYDGEAAAADFAASVLVADVLAAGRCGAAAPVEAVLPEEGAVLWRAVPGRPLSALLRAGDHSGAHVPLQQAGRLVRALHDATDEVDVPIMRAVADTVRDAARELPLVARATEHLPVLLPGLRTRLEAVLGSVADRLDSVPAESPTLTHGDYKADHLLIGAKGLTVLDFDRVGPAEPARDLGKFLADLHWWLRAAAPAELRAAQHAFLAGYGPCPEHRMARARALEALFVVKLAARRPKLAGPAWGETVGALLARAEALTMAGRAA